MRNRRGSKSSREETGKNDKTLSEISLNNKNNFEEIIKNLSIGRHYITRSNKNDKEKISVSIIKEDTKRHL